VPPPVYTELLWEGSFDGGTLDVGGPPSGFRWVIVDMNVVIQGGAGANTGSAVNIYKSTGPSLFIAQANLSQVGGVYRWSGRQVVDNPTTVKVLIIDGFEADISATGYVLTLP